jgi:hypothetical protein
VNAFCAEHLNPYLNFHRPCLFAEESCPIWYESERGNVFPTRYESEAK